MRTMTRRHGAWQRATRAWLVTMMIGLFALTLAGPVGAIKPPPPGGPVSGTPVGTGGGRTPMVQPTAPVSFLTCDLFQCITTVHIDTAGRGVGFVIFDTQSSVATVQLSKIEPTKNASGDLAYNPGDVVAFTVSSKDYVHSVDFTGLDAGTTYHYLINAAKGSVGPDAQKTGTFTTLKRYVTTTINSITVIDDSDTFGPGNLVFNLKVDGSAPAAYPDQAYIDFKPEGGSTTPWGSGESRNLDMEVKTVSDGSVGITLQGWDWDSGVPNWIGPINIDTDTVGEGGVLGTASVGLDVMGNDDSTPVWKDFTVQTNNNQGVKFKATGYVSTTYAP